MHINRYIQWRGNRIWSQGAVHMELAAGDTEQQAIQCYKDLGLVYPKFFKMDLLSKVAFLSAELLAPYPSGIPQAEIATVISSGSGCIEVDKKYEESRKQIASPALFVYTLPNIMLGEVCIRHGFKGEQMCTISAPPNSDWLSFWVQDLLSQPQRATSACLCGHVEATAEEINACLMWVQKGKEHPEALSFNPRAVAHLLHQNPETCRKPV